VGDKSIAMLKDGFFTLDLGGNPSAESFMSAWQDGVLQGGIGTAISLNY